jgi:enoyl-CoA hydratase/carnithine racemase
MAERSKLGTEPAVLYEVRDRIGLITLNRPSNRNSMTPELLDEFSEASRRARADPELRAVVIVGRGSCFSAGADFRSVVQRSAPGRYRFPHERSFAMYEPFLSVLDIEVPVVAGLNGHAVGGGFGLALLCDIRVASSEAKYGANFAKLGIHAGLGITHTLPRSVGLAKAAEMLFTGRLLTGTEAARLGLANEAVAAADVPSRSLAVAAEIAENAPLALRALKRGLRGADAGAIREAAWQESFVQAQTLETEDAAEGMAALLEKRRPQFHGR